MKAALEDNGWTPTSRIRVLADGADGLSNLVDTAAEETTHGVRDWFHISMRPRPIGQMSPGIVTIVGDADPVLTELLSEKIEFAFRCGMGIGSPPWTVWERPAERPQDIQRSGGICNESLGQ